MSARDVLIEQGHLVVVEPPNQFKSRAGRYRLTLPESDNNHYTPSPLLVTGMAPQQQQRDVSSVPFQ